MQVLVIGAGVIGISTAYYLAKEGVSVTVIDRNTEPALESSFANGAQLSYSHSEPWSSKASIFKALKWMWKKDAPLYFRPLHAMKASSWVLQFLMEARSSHYFHNAKAINNLAFYSRDLMFDLIKDVDLNFDYSEAGILHFYANQRALDADYKFFSHLKSFNEKLEIQVLKSKEINEQFKNMEYATKKRVGAIHCKSDHLGDIHKFTLQLAQECQRLGVKIVTNAKLDGFKVDGSAITSVIIDGKEQKFDKIVLAAGAYSGVLAKKAGISIPIYPMKGYSITASNIDNSLLPKPSITDHSTKIVLTPLNNAIRIGGTAEFGGFDHSVNKYRIVPLIKSLKRNFPKIAASPKIEITEFACLRSQTPRSYPYICKTKVGNLYLNTGHGSLGWTQALGSAKLITDIMLGKPTQLNAQDYS